MRSHPTSSAKDLQQFGHWDAVSAVVRGSSKDPAVVGRYEDGSVDFLYLDTLAANVPVTIKSNKLTPAAKHTCRVRSGAGGVEAWSRVVGGPNNKATG